MVGPVGDDLTFVSWRAFNYFICHPPRGVCLALDRIIAGFEQQYPGITRQVAEENMRSRHALCGSTFVGARFVNDVQVEFKFNRELPPWSAVKDLNVSNAKIRTPPSDNPHFVLKLKLTETIYSAVIVPLGYLLKMSEEDLTAENTNQLYEHSFLSKKSIAKAHRASRNAALRSLKGLQPAGSIDPSDRAYKYIGLTSRTWQERYDEHMRASLNGSNTLFHKALRKEGFTSDYGGMQEHVVIRAGLSDEWVNRLEEDFVAKNSFVQNTKFGLNMIPGGKAGFAYLKSMDYQGGGGGRKRATGETLEHLETDLSPLSGLGISALINGDKAVLSNASKSAPSDRIRNADKPRDWVSNIEEVQQYVQAATSYNIERRCGRLPKLPTPPRIVIKEGLAASDFYKAEAAIKDKICVLNSSSEFVQHELKLAYREGSFLSGETRLEVHHKKCGTVSLVAFNSIKEKTIGSRKLKVTCSKRECFEAQTGVKLGENAATPSRKGVTPVNAKSVQVATKEVSDASEGLLELIPSTYTDVRNSYWVQIHCAGSVWDKHFLCIGGHNNALRKNVFKAHVERIRNNKPFSYKTKLQLEAPSN